MALTNVSGKRVDPFRGFKFRVIIAGVESAGFSSVEGLEGATEKTEYREGDEGSTMRKLPGLSSFSDITLNRGKSVNDDLQRWRDQVFQAEQQGMKADEDLRRAVQIELVDRLGKVVKAWDVKNAWPTELNHPVLDAQSSDVWIETLILANEGWVQKDISGSDSGSLGETLSDAIGAFEGSS